MKSVARSLLLLSLFVALLTACKKGVPKQVKFIPKSANVVVSINGESIKDKLKNSEEDIERILKNVSVENDTALDKGKKEWSDLKDAGIDLDDQFYVWAIKENAANGRQKNLPGSIMGAVGGLEDAGKFEAYLKKKMPAATPQKEKEYSYITKDGDKMVAWGKDVIVVLQYQQSFSPQVEYDSAMGDYNMQQAPPVDMRNQLKAQMNVCFSQNESASVADITAFRNLMQEKADASLWVNTANSLQDLPLPLPKLTNLVGDAYTAATLQFEAGKISINSKSYSSKALGDIFKEYAGPEVNLDLVQKYPSSNINGFMAFAFDPQLINGIVKYLEVGALVDGFLTNFMGSNYTLPQFLKAFKGDIAVTVSDFEVETADTTTQNFGEQPKPMAKMVYTMTVGDKTEMNRIMDRLVTMNMAEKVNGVYRPAGLPNMFGLTARVDDKALTIASDESLMNAYLAGNGKAVLPGGVMDDFKGKAGVGYVDIATTLKSFPIKSANGEDAAANVRQTFKDAKFYLDNFNGEFTEGHAELRMTDEKTNSLNTLIKLVANQTDYRRRNNSVDMPN